MDSDPDNPASGRQGKRNSNTLDTHVEELEDRDWTGVRFPPVPRAGVSERAVVAVGTLRDERGGSPRHVLGRCAR